MQWIKLSELKTAESVGVPAADPMVSGAAAAPVPAPAIGRSPAPGLRGPKGLGPRTNYSRVNTGAPPVIDALGGALKSLTPAMPHPKLATAEAPMAEVTRRLSIQEMIRAALEGTTDAAISKEARSRELGPDRASEERSATRAHSETPESISTSYAEKLASAVEYILETEKLSAEAGPGTGSGALALSEAHPGKPNIEASGQGQATGDHQPPKNPSTQADPSRSGDPGTGLQTNERRKVASSVSDEPPLALIRKIASASVAPEPDRAHADPRLVEHLLSLKKQAEDAINPARISAGKVEAPETSSAGKPAGAPAGGMPQGSRHLVASNDAAINATKAEAKAKAKSDAEKLVDEPVQSSATDKTLELAFDHSRQAGVKISEATKVAATRALLEKLAAEGTRDASRTRAQGAEEVR